MTRGSAGYSRLAASGAGAGAAPLARLADALAAAPADADADRGDAGAPALADRMSFFARALYRQDDIALAPSIDRADMLGSELLRAIAAAEPDSWWAMAKVIVRTCCAPFFHIVSLLGVPMAFKASASAAVLSALLRAVAANRQAEALGWAVLLVGIELLRRLHQSASWYLIMRSWMRTNAAVRSAVFQQSLAVGSIPRGRANNLLMQDPRTCGRATRFLYQPVTLPLEVLFTFGALWNFIGAGPALAAGGIFAIVAPLNYYGIRKLDDLSTRLAGLKDRRVARITEMLANMSVIKLFAWESHFKAKINAIRTRELKYVRTFQYAIALIMFLILSTGSIVSLVAFGVYSALGNEMTADVIFPALVLINSLYWPLLILPEVISYFVEYRTALRRLNQFFNEKPRAQLTNAKLPAPQLDAENVLELRDATLAWPPPPAVYTTDIDDEEDVAEPIDVDNEEVSRADDDERVRRFKAKVDEYQRNAQALIDNPVLKHISLRVPRGSLVAVVGRVGCGKSALVNAVLGEMQLLDGRMRRNVERCSYVPQKAWIRNGTLRDNVLLGRSYDKARWDDVVHATALEPDLKQLKGGEFCEIGEKGVTLSGGQKQRVSLARAAYEPGDFVLLDDPLSAVDATVGKHIFDKLLSRRTGLLRESSILLVTHQLQFLPRCDTIAVMADGEIEHYGSYTELIAKGVNFAELIDLSHDDDDDKDEKAKDEKPDVVVTPATNEALLIDIDGVGDSQPVSSGSLPLAEVDLRFSDGDDDHRYERKVDAAFATAALSPRSRTRVLQQALRTSNESGQTLHVPKLRTTIKRSSDADMFSDAFPHEQIGAPATALRALSHSLESFEELDSNLKTSLHLQNVPLDDDDKEGAKKGGQSEEDEEARLRAEGKLVEDEEREVGNVSNQTYKRFLWIMTGGRTQFILLVCGVVFSQIFQSGSTMWLGHWSSAKDATDHSWRYLEVYVTLGISYSLCTLLRQFFWAHQSLMGARQLHATLLESILRAPMSFFFKTPVGRIVARFSSDIEEVDRWLPDQINDAALISLQVVASIVVVIIYCPWLALVMIPFLISLRVIHRQYHGAALDVGRLFAETNSPLFAHYEETLHGAPSIRAGEYGELVLREHHRKAHVNQKAEYAQLCGSRWLDMRLALCSIATYFATTALLCFAQNLPGVAASMAGFIIVTTTSFTDALGWALVCGTNVQRSMARIERLFQFSSIVPEERAIYAEKSEADGTMAARLLRDQWSVKRSASLSFDGDSDGDNNAPLLSKPKNASDLSLEEGFAGGRKSSSGGVEMLIESEFFARRELARQVHAPANWPTEGKLEFRDVQLRYRRGAPLALNGVSFVVPPRSKVGVVGRTGAGKSSLSMALFRLVELSGGSIVLDGVDLSDLSLRDVREAIAIIPQEALLFEGTFRENMDIAGRHSDAELWQALEHMQLAEYVRSLPRQLAEPLSTESLSVGQRQLLCLARALLHDTRVLMLDEATASIDPLSDNLIQVAIRKHLGDRTLITIAHRLSSIMDYDYVCVMDKGRVAEFGPPRELAQKHNGQFAALVAAHEEQTRKQMQSSSME